MSKIFCFILITSSIFYFILINEKKTFSNPNIIIVFTDDMGYADIGCYGILQDNKTPNIDALSKNGIRADAGYSTAPQCVPSRAGIITGQYQNKFGLEENHHSPLPLHIPTIAERIKKQGYTTGFVGKWHLGISPYNRDWLSDNEFENIKLVDSLTFFNYFPWNRGFDKVFCGNGSIGYANFDLNGRNYNKVKRYKNNTYRLDLQSEAALSFINQSKNEPFFLFLSYFGPHTPLDAPDKYLSRFKDDMPNRRRLALAMNAAIDDGVGNIVKTLEKNNILENTIIFFVSDNGAPLMLYKKDLPISRKRNLWNGSLNDPWIGEKGMLTEGGIRVPFIVSWKGEFSEEQTYEYPITCLDISATAVALAGGKIEDLDGVNLIPYLKKTNKNAPHSEIFWRWKGQEAVRDTMYKYLRYSDGHEYLFNLKSIEHEKNNVIDEYPEIAEQLKHKLEMWSKSLLRPRQADGLSSGEKTFRNYYLE